MDQVIIFFHFQIQQLVCLLCFLPPCCLHSCCSTFAGFSPTHLVAQNWQSLKSHNPLLLNHLILTSCYSMSKLRHFALLLWDHSLPKQSHAETCVLQDKNWSNRFLIFYFFFCFFSLLAWLLFLEPANKSQITSRCQLELFKRWYFSQAGTASDVV